MDRAPKPQIPHHRDREVLQPALRPTDRVEIEHRLRGVLIGTVAGIDNRDLSHLAGILGRPLEEVAHDDQVGVVGDHLDGVVQALALRRAAGTRIGEADHPTPKAIDSGLKAETRPGGRLKKKRRRHATLQEVTIGLTLEALRHIKDPKYLLLRELIDRIETVLIHSRVFMNVLI